MHEKTLYKTLYSKLSGEHEQDLMIVRISKLIRDQVKSGGVHVSIQRDSEIEPGSIVVTGRYDPIEDEAHANSIDIFIMCNQCERTINLPVHVRKRLCIDVVECLGHQLIHQSQYRARDFGSSDSFFVGNNNEQSYLGNPDEIEAYGYSVAVSMYLTYPPIKVPGVLVARMLTKNIFAKSYVDQFGSRHSVTLKLIEYATKFYDQLVKTGTVDRSTIN
jgi:hypothetical protein